MKYYIITARQAEELSLKRCRAGNDCDGYLVNIGDLAVYGPERAVDDGAREVTIAEAKEFAKHNKQ